MQREPTQLERLDTAARAEVAKASFYVYSWIFSALAVTGLLLAAISQAAFYETLSVWVFAATTTFTAVVMWRQWRYALHTGALFFFAVAFAFLMNWGQHPPSIWSWIERVALAVLYANFGYRLLTRGAVFASADRAGWEQERKLACMWLKRLTNLATESQGL